MFAVSMMDNAARPRSNVRRPAESRGPAMQSETASPSLFNRRTLLTAAATAAAGAVLAPISKAADRDWSGKNPTRYPDPDIIVLDKRFAKYKIGNTPIQRLYTGMLWAEGPAWSGEGNYLVWSDIPNNR